jgi:two-component system, response regulator YesN
LLRDAEMIPYFKESLLMKTSGQSIPENSVVFVVDDEPMLLELAAVILKPIGCEVFTYRDPETALKEVPLRQPEVIITDYAMGRMSGMDLIRECRRLNPDQKMILVSGTVDEHVFADAPVKPNRFIVKPYQLQEFTDCVRALILA